MEHGWGTANLIEKKNTSKENPAITTLRKKGLSSFLLFYPRGSERNYKWTATGWFWSEGTNHANRVLDILAPIGRDGRWAEVEYADLRLEARLDSTNRCWTVTLSTTNETDGLVLSDELLFEAPTSGYMPQGTLSVTGRTDQIKYIYLRSRMPSIYTRILLKYYNWYDNRTKENLRFFIAEWINPYGGRTFEYDGRPASVPALTRILTEEAKAAIRAGKHPEYPDIPQRVKEQEEKEAAEKEKYAEFRRLTREANERRQKEGEERKKREAENK
jgi:hypothetical protein